MVQVWSKRYRDGTVTDADPDIKIVTDLFPKVDEYDKAILVSGEHAALRPVLLLHVCEHHKGSF